MSKYEKVIDDYISKHNITKDNIDDRLKEIGYINFFNEFTIECLGKPTTQFKSTSQTSSSLVYLPDASKELLIPQLDIVYVTQLYCGILTKGNLKFNYKNYELFLKDLFKLRVNVKKRIKDAYKDIDDLIIKNAFIKIYINVIYGMIDKPESILSSELDNSRAYIVETAKKVVATVASFFLNKSLPVYYIDTDEMFVSTISDEVFSELESYYNDKCKDMIDIEISRVDIDDSEKKMQAYILAKKKMIIGCKDTRTRGMTWVDDKKVLNQNKKYFGRNFKDVFPEYVIW